MKYPSYIETLDERAGFDTLPGYEQARALFQEEIEALGIKFSAVRIPARPDSDGFKDACHAHCTLVFKSGRVLSSDYSAGKVAALSHIKTVSQAIAAYRKSPQSRDYRNGSGEDIEQAWLTRSRYGGSPLWQERILDGIRGSWLPSLLDVFAALCRDATEESFDDFCSSFGYDTDSRKAEKMWTTCRETSRFLNQELGRGKFESLQNLAHEL
jgi:hypothetical protein